MSIVWVSIRLVTTWAEPGYRYDRNDGTSSASHPGRPENAAIGTGAVTDDEDLLWSPDLFAEPLQHGAHVGRPPVVEGATAIGDVFAAPMQVPSAVRDDDVMPVGYRVVGIVLVVDADVG
jgi:hypothetical protein